MNYYEHHLGDYVRDTTNLTMVEDGAYRRLMDAYYVREKALPVDITECHRLARAANKREREAVVYVLAQFFTLQGDGYHQKRIDREIVTYQDSAPERALKREQTAERQRRSRERRRSLFEQLRAYDIVPSYDASMSDLESQLSRAKSRVTTGAVNGNGHALHHAPVTRDATASQSPLPIPTPHSQIKTSGAGAIKIASSEKPMETGPEKRQAVEALQRIRERIGKHA